MFSIFCCCCCCEISSVLQLQEKINKRKYCQFTIGDIYIYIYIYIDIYTHTHTHTHTYIYIPTHIYVCISFFQNGGGITKLIVDGALMMKCEYKDVN